MVATFIKTFLTFCCTEKQLQKMKVEIGELLYSEYSYNHHPDQEVEL